MRKSELIAAIRERRGEKNGASAVPAKDTAAAPAESAPSADAAPAQVTAEAQPTTQRRERRSASEKLGWRRYQS